MIIKIHIGKGILENIYAVRTITNLKNGLSQLTFLNGNIMIIFTENIMFVEGYQ